MKPTRKKTRKEIKRLREFINKSDDQIACRIAYAIESALRWSVEETVAWETPLQMAIDNAIILRKVELNKS